MNAEVEDGEYEIPAEINLKVAGDEYTMATANLPIYIKDGKAAGVEESVVAFLRELADRVERGE